MLAAMPSVAPAPPFSAVLVAAHGDGGTDPRNNAVRALAAALGDRLGLPVAWAVIRDPDSFGRARTQLGAAADGTVAVYPLFMADGFFVSRKLPALLSDAGFGEVVRLPPLGHDPGLTDLVERRLRSTTDRLGHADAGLARIVMIAHGSGSGDGANRRSAEALAAQLAERGLRPRLGFIEESPFYDAVIAEAAPEIVVGLFASEGTHALDDVRSAVEANGSVRHHIAAIGTDAEIVELAENAIRHVDQR